MNKLEKAFELFDAYNRRDPKIIVWDETEFPSEYFYSLQLHSWVKKLNPEASEELLLASRAQHIGRWEIKREAYPEGKAGYLNWRTTLAKFHAQKGGEIMKEVGYDEEQIQRVQSIIKKERIKLDEEVQTMENALCLVFLQFQYEEFLKQHDENKMIRILQKSWAKMSDPGRAAALTLQFNDEAKTLLEKALS